MGQLLKLCVMTFNIRHGKGEDGKVDLARTADEIKRCGADVVGLQEVDRRHFRSGFADQPARLAEMTGMEACFSASLRLWKIEYGNAILSRFPVRSHRIVYLPGVTERRTLLIAELDTPDGPLTVVNTHLGLIEVDRSRQLPIVMETLRGLKGPAVFMGDLNMRPMNKGIRELAAEWHKLGLEGKTPTMHGGGEIDYIFVNRPLEAAAAAAVPTVASDHNPIVARLAMRTDVAARVVPAVSPVAIRIGTKELPPAASGE